ncbi:hypothetical protein OGATHE_004733 [Ogataea polymorpha]|uniref:Uncharacterized protein n=1 Tax=Ogataea polymorpha TaxID=460523 RepID=A0A9P8P0Z4_9ASCO|nr:hypothetical protein OGATHE_004733 [Ogataea polymorpha]
MALLTPTRRLSKANSKSLRTTDCSSRASLYRIPLSPRTVTESDLAEDCIQEYFFLDPLIINEAVILVCLCSAIRSPSFLSSSRPKAILRFSRFSSLSFCLVAMSLSALDISDFVPPDDCFCFVRNPRRLCLETTSRSVTRLDMYSSQALDMRFISSSSNSIRLIPCSSIVLFINQATCPGRRKSLGLS